VTLAQYLVALAAVATGAVAQSSVGFGFGMIAAPVLALVDRDLVPGAVLLLGLLVAVIIAWQERGALDWLGIRWALVGRVMGTVVGGFAVSQLDRNALSIVLGALVLLAVLVSIAGWHVRPTPATLVGAGTMSGVMGTLTSVGGPPMALVYQREQSSTVRSTLAGFFVFGASLALLALLVSGELERGQVVDGAMLVPGLAAGLVVGHMLTPLLDRGWSRAAILGLSAATATALIVGSVS
jgi:uncharacterized membrane protein YfcA